jgi:hypothetical protein
MYFDAMSLGRQEKHGLTHGICDTEARPCGPVDWKTYGPEANPASACMFLDAKPRGACWKLRAVICGQCISR